MRGFAKKMLLVLGIVAKQKDALLRPSVETLL